MQYLVLSSLAVQQEAVDNSETSPLLPAPAEPRAAAKKDKGRHYRRLFALVFCFSFSR